MTFSHLYGSCVRQDGCWMESWCLASPWSCIFHHHLIARSVLSCFLPSDTWLFAPLLHFRAPLVYAQNTIEQQVLEATEMSLRPMVAVLQASPHHLEDIFVGWNNKCDRWFTWFFYVLSAGLFHPSPMWIDSSMFELSWIAWALKHANKSLLSSLCSVRPLHVSVSI